MRFLNKFVLLFEAKENKETEHQIEQILRAVSYTHLDVYKRQLQ